MVTETTINKRHSQSLPTVPARQGTLRKQRALIRIQQNQSRPSNVTIINGTVKPANSSKRNENNGGQAERTLVNNARKQTQRKRPDATPRSQTNNEYTLKRRRFLTHHH
jgi:hypothetical protein